MALLLLLLVLGPTGAFASTCAYVPVIGNLSNVESTETGLAWLWMLLAVCALNLGCWGAFWYWGWRGLTHRLQKANRALEHFQTQEDAHNLKLQEHISKTRRAIEGFRAELSKLTALDERVHKLEQAEPVQVIYKPTVSTNEPKIVEDSAVPVPSVASPVSTITLNDGIDFPALVTRGRAEQAELGRWFVEEIQNTHDGDATGLWDRYLARVKTRHPQAMSRQLYWDRVRAQIELRFEEQRSDRFTDTGRCWQIELAEDAWLFFPNLVADVRKSDLPGCRIISNDDAFLAAARLQSYLPPGLMRDDVGWIVLELGEVRYQ